MCKVPSALKVKSKASIQCTIVHCTIPLYIHTMEYYLAIRKDEYPPFASTWMELEGIMVSEISQAEKDNYRMVSLICGT